MSGGVPGGPGAACPVWSQGHVPFTLGVENYPTELRDFCLKSLSHVFGLFATPWTVQSVEFSRPDYWSW